MEKIILTLKALSLRFYEKYKERFGEDKGILDSLEQTYNSAENILKLEAKYDNYIKIEVSKREITESLSGIIKKLRLKSLALGYDEYIEEYINSLQKFGNALTGLARRKLIKILENRKTA